jgi:hypothetical protein
VRFNAFRCGHVRRLERERDDRYMRSWRQQQQQQQEEPLLLQIGENNFTVACPNKNGIIINQPVVNRIYRCIDTRYLVSWFYWHDDEARKECVCERHG